MSTNSSLINDKDTLIRSIGYGTPTAVLLAAIGAGLTKKRSSLAKFLGTVGLPAAYLTYIAGRKGNGGFEQWDGSDLLNRVTYPINDAGWAGLLALSEGILDNKLGFNSPNPRNPNVESSRLQNVATYHLYPWKEDRPGFNN